MITAKFSRKLYDKLGDEVAAELVDWFNTVDLSYRTEFRELFETHFSRFEARLGQQSAELRAEFGRELAALRKEGAQESGEIRKEIAELRANIQERISRSETSIIRWMFLFWIGSWATLIGSVIALRRIGWLAAP
jgi:hypothetical protein